MLQKRRAQLKAQKLEEKRAKKAADKARREAAAARVDEDVDSDDSDEMEVDEEGASKKEEGADGEGVKDDKATKDEKVEKVVKEGAAADAANEEKSDESSDGDDDDSDSDAEEEETCELPPVANNIQGHENGVRPNRYRFKNLKNPDGSDKDPSELRIQAKITADTQALRDVSTGTQLLLHERFPDDVQIAKVKGHYIFSIEAIGQISAQACFSRALAHLSEKCRITCEVLRRKMEAEKAAGPIH